MAFCCAPVLEEDDIKHRETSIEYIRRSADTGDIFFAAGRGMWSNIVRRYAESRIWSHIGIFVRDFDSTLYILDVDLDGVKMLEFEEYRSQYEGYCFGLRKLKDIAPTDRQNFTTKLKNFFKEEDGKEYSTFHILFNSLTRSNEDDPVSQRRYFCVQLVVKAYRELGLLDKVKEQRSSNAQLLDFIEGNSSVIGYTGPIRLSDKIFFANID